MPLALVIPLLGLVGGVIGATVGLFIQRRISQTRVEDAERNADRILNEADKRQREIVLEAKEEARRTRQQNEAELRERRKEVQRTEQRINQKEENLDRKTESLE